jgi:putative NADH-flavin reductase
MISTGIEPREHCPGGSKSRRIGRALQLVVLSVCASLLLACASPGPIPAPPAHSTSEGEVRAHHTVALLGASGMVGEYLLREALARGYTVRVLARTPAKLAEFADRITIIQGDARDPAVIEALLQGSDVVISALGPVRTDGAAAHFINTTTTANVLQAMQGKDISQYMVVSGAAVVMPGDERDLLGWWIRTLAQIGLRDELEDKQAEYELLATSSVDWMLVRCPLIDAQPARWPVLASTHTPPAFRVRGGEVAQFMLDQIDARQFVRAGPFLGSRQTGPAL